jgi:hypothetical protein
MYRTLLVSALTPGHRHLGVAFVCSGTVVLLVSYLAICLHAGSPWPWHVVVHENGRLTLLGTVLFYEHAARELPLDLLLGLAVGGSTLLIAESRGAALRGRPRAAIALLLALTAGTILIGGAVEVGPAGLAENLLQKPTRPGAPPVWGAHWHYHLLSRLALLFVSLGFAGVIRCWSGGGSGLSDRMGLMVVIGTFAGFIVLTIVFAAGPTPLTMPFTDSRYLGHQARELLTHGLVTLPIAFGCCLILIGQTAPIDRVHHGAQGRRVAGPAWLRGAAASAILGTALAGYVGIASLVTGAASRGQADDPVTLIFPHVFEHGFTYLVVSLTACLVVASGLRTACGRHSGPT